MKGHDEDLNPSVREEVVNIDLLSESYEQRLTWTLEFLHKRISRQSWLSVILTFNRRLNIGSDLCVLSDTKKTLKDITPGPVPRPFRTTGRDLKS